MVVLVAACSGGSHPTAGSTSPPETPSTTAKPSAAARAAEPTGSATSTETATTSTLLCAPSNTTARVAFGQGAAGTDYVEFDVTNRSKKPCRTGGYPGALLLDAAGRPLPTHVLRDSALPPNAAGSPADFLVAPGSRFYVEFHYSATEPGCDRHEPPTAPKMRLTLPDNRAFVVVSLPRTDHSQPILACKGRLSAYRVYARHR
jgi:hypothetical protein